MDKYVVGIGSTNVDLYCKSSIAIREHYDHPGIVNYTAGGVTRNILENISKLGLKTKLLTAVGDDIYGAYILDELEHVKVDHEDVKIVRGGRTGLFVQVQDSNNDMHMAVCDMSILEKVDITYIKKKNKVIKNASAIILDPALNKDTLDYIFENYEDIPIFVDPISDVYAKKIKPYLSKIYCIKPNKSELFILADNAKDDSYENLIKAYKKVLKKGVKKVYVSLGKDGCMYNDDENTILTRKFKEVDNMVNASGAGDSFFAAIVYSYVNGLSIDDTIDNALGAGIAAIMCEETINPKLSIKFLRRIIKENR